MSNNLNQRKYEFTGEEQFDWMLRPVFRIRRLSDGKIGGWITGEHNLSHLGDCWVDQKAVVTGDAKVCDDALVTGCSYVFEHARISQNAVISGCSSVGGEAQVYDNAYVTGNVSLNDTCKVFGFAHLCGCVAVKDSVRICGTACINGDGEDDLVIQGDFWVLDKVLVLPMPRANILMFDQHIGIGCESHSIEVWLKDIREIGLDNYYDHEMIELYRAVIHKALSENVKYEKFWSLLKK